MPTPFPAATPESLQQLVASTPTSTPDLSFISACEFFLVLGLVLMLTAAFTKNEFSIRALMHAGRSAARAIPYAIAFDALLWAVGFALAGSADLHAAALQADGAQFLTFFLLIWALVGTTMAAQRIPLLIQPLSGVARAFIPGEVVQLDASACNVWHNVNEHLYRALLGALQAASAQRGIVFVADFGSNREHQVPIGDPRWNALAGDVARARFRYTSPGAALDELDRLAKEAAAKNLDRTWVASLLTALRECGIIPAEEATLKRGSDQADELLITTGGWKPNGGAHV